MYNMSCESLMVLIYFFINVVFTQTYFFPPSNICGSGSLHIQSTQFTWLRFVQLIFIEHTKNNMWRVHTLRFIFSSTAFELLCIPSLCPRVRGAVEYALLDDPLLFHVYEPSNTCDPRFERSHAEKLCLYMFYFLYACGLSRATISPSFTQPGDQCTLCTVVLTVHVQEHILHDFCSAFNPDKCYLGVCVGGGVNVFTNLEIRVGRAQ